MGGQRNLELRGEIFNVFLRYNATPTLVGTALNNLTTFGKLGAGNSDRISRIVQLSGKFYF